MEQSKILIIDDEKAICAVCAQILSAEQYLVATSHDGASGLAKIDEFHPDVVFVDLKMPGIGGIEVLDIIRNKDPLIVSVVITGFATIESAVESMKVGAYDFLPKPFTPDQLRLITRRALEKRTSVLESERLRQEKEAMRQNFISMVSHELRTPLVAVAQYLEVLQRGFAGSVSAEQSRIIGRMKIRLTELLNLIDRWLKLSRLEEIKLKEGFREFPLCAVIKEATDMVRDFAQEKGVTISLETACEDTVVVGDREMIKEVFVNLINNGVKYNRESGKVAIQVRDLGELLYIDVIDTGIGIPEKDLIHVGEEFFRVKREGSAAAGTGIGLAIVKKILDLHEGKLEISSQMDQGSAFRVHLPKILQNKGAR